MLQFQQQQFDLNLQQAMAAHAMEKTVPGSSEDTETGGHASPSSCRGYTKTSFEAGLEEKVSSNRNASEVLVVQQHQILGPTILFAERRGHFFTEKDRDR